MPRPPRASFPTEDVAAAVSADPAAYRPDSDREPKVVRAQPSDQRPSGSDLPILVLYLVAIVGNAALLFSVEPLFSKLVLPLLGGSSAVWTTCMMFYQAALLAGYAYAHVTTRWLPGRGQAIAHVALLALSCLVLPVRVAHGWSPPTSGTPVLWLFGLLTVSLGAPFLALSAGAPLIQRWFAHTGHSRRADPYFLYAASNAGSLSALLAYPTIIEPLLPLSRQTHLWSAAYVGLTILLVACVLVAWRGLTVEPTAQSAERDGESTPPAAPVGKARVARWVALSALPSSLLLGVTTHLSTDVAPVPLLWVGPLSLYLATFVWAFGRQARGAPALLVQTQALVVIPLLLITAFGAVLPLSIGLAWHLLAFTVTALACHARLAADRPPPAALTGYYLWISVGGLLGGVFNSLFAPLIFSSVTEYPLALALGVGLVAGSRHGAVVAWRTRDLVLAAAIGLAAWGGVRLALLVPLGGPWPWLVLIAGLAVVSVLLLAAAERPLRLTLAATLALAGVVTARDAVRGSLFAGRSFYGAYRVRPAPSDPGIHVLEHGNTIHGAQDTRPALRRDPRTYYARSGPVGDIFAALPPAVAAGRVGAVGLGSGSLACYARPGARWTFFEIDPLMERIARDPALFTFLSECAPDARVEIGDARLALGQLPAASVDLLLLDAFSSDAVPAHLLTTEAFALYLRVLAPRGVLGVHVTNRYLDIDRVVAAAARAHGLNVIIGTGVPTAAERLVMITPARWITLARRPEDLGTLASRPGWAPLRVKPAPWTDDYSDVVGILRGRTRRSNR